MAFATKASTYQTQAMSAVGGDLSRLRVPTAEETQVFVERFKYVPESFKQRQATIDYPTLMFEAMRRQAENQPGALPIDEVEETVD